MYKVGQVIEFYDMFGISIGTIEEIRERKVDLVGNKEYRYVVATSNSIINSIVDENDVIGVLDYV